MTSLQTETLNKHWDNEWEFLNLKFKINNNDSSKSQKCQILNYPMYLSHNKMVLNTQVYIIILLSFKAVPKL